MARHGFTPPVEIPAEVLRHYDRWHEQHPDSGTIPARAVYGLDESGNKLWCSLPEADPELLMRVAEFHNAQGLLKLARYRKDPTPELAVGIAGHMVAVDVAEQLRKWLNEGITDWRGPTP
jgi:hypothetical protein